MKKVAVLILGLILLAVGIGCLPMSYYLTPGDDNPGGKMYVLENNPDVDPNSYEGWFGVPNLATAIRLQKDIDTTHARVQQFLNHKIEEDKLEHSIHSKTQGDIVSAGIQREQLLFGPKGIVTLGLSIAGAGTLAGYVGLMRRKPGDVAKGEFDKLLNKTLGKDTQIYDLVKSVQAFKDTLPKDDPLRVTMKEIFNKKQGPETQAAVTKYRTMI